MDNTNSNKSWAVIAGCAALIELGLVRKVRISYCLVGHTHEDIDAVIGTLVCSLRVKNIASMSVYAEAIRQAISKANARILEVEVLQGLPNYETMFSSQNFNVGHAEGIMGSQEFRLSMHNDGCSVQMHYRTDSTLEGWLPRHVLPSAALSHTWGSYFVSKDPLTQGRPITFTHHPMTVEWRTLFCRARRYTALARAWHKPLWPSRLCRRRGRGEGPAGRAGSPMHHAAGAGGRQNHGRAALERVRR